MQVNFMDAVSFSPQPRQIFRIVSNAPQDVFNKGDVLRGRVVSVENNIAVLRLSDGSALTVKVPDGLEIDINTVIALEVHDRIEGQLMAKILSIVDFSENDRAETPSPGNEDISGLLDTTDTGTLSQIVRKIISLNGEPTSKLISDTIDLLNLEPGLTAGQGVFAAMNSIKPDSGFAPQMLGILRKISEHEFELTGSLQQLKSGLQQAVSKADIPVRQEIVRLLVIENQIKTMVSEIKSELPQFSEAVSDPAVQESLKELLANGTITAENSGALTGEAAETSGPAEKLLSILAALKNTPEETETERAYIAEGRENLPAGLESEAAVKLMNILHRAAEKTNSRLSRAAQDIENEVRSLLDEIFDRVVISEDELSDASILKEKARSFSDVIKLARHIMERLDINNENILFQTFNEIDQAFRFFSQVTTYDYCLQFPLRFKNDQTTGELYIMKRKGRNKIDLNDFTLFISLRTKALGLTEAFINSKNKRISINFRLEKEELVRLFKDNYMMLYNSLAEKGYMLVDFKCRLMEKDRTSIINAAEKAEKYFNPGSKVDLKI